MATASYETVLEMAESLPPEERTRLIQKLEQRSVVPTAHSDKKHSIMELEGLGREIWQGIDAKEYVRKLRAEWDG
jgi:hypothetical protein